MSDRERADLVTVIVGFAAVLREEGLATPPPTTSLAIQALASLDPAADSGYWALRCAFVSRQEEIEPFDRAFARYWLEAGPTPPENEPPTPGSDPDSTSSSSEDQGRRDSRPGAGSIDRDGRRQTGADVVPMGVRASAAEQLRGLDFAAYQPADSAAARQEMERIARLLPKRQERRLRANRGGDQMDLRRTLIAARRTGGVPLERRWRAPRPRPARLVMILDVSGSMARYSYALLVFALAAMRLRRRVETFTFGTRLTRITEQLRLRPDEWALASAAAAIPDWSGGTWIGQNLRTLNDRWGALGVTRGATVMLLSDGLERGDPADLGRELGRLRRGARAVFWVNPLAASPRYEPRAAGMAAALPHLDRLLPGNDLRSLERLVAEIAAFEAPAAARSR